MTETPDFLENYFTDLEDTTKSDNVRMAIKHIRSFSNFEDFLEDVGEMCKMTEPIDLPTEYTSPCCNYPGCKKTCSTYIEDKPYCEKHQFCSAHSPNYCKVWAMDDMPGLDLRKHVHGRTIATRVGKNGIAMCANHKICDGEGCLTIGFRDMTYCRSCQKHLKR